MMTLPTTATFRSERVVLDADILPWLGYVDAVASRLAASGRARRAGVEFDDLYQEGLNAVFLSILRGTDPKLPIENRMKDWIRLQKRQKDGDPVPYETLLPTEAPGGGL
jgi:hypothetical protein